MPTVVCPGGRHQVQRQQEPVRVVRLEEGGRGGSGVDAAADVWHMTIQAEY
jgi:hypothetical protein